MNSNFRPPSARRPAAAIAALTACLLAAGLATPLLASAAETVVLFDFDAGETPESIVFDRRDNAYITLNFLGEIVKVAPDGTVTSLAFLPIGGPCAPLPAVALGLAIDIFDRLFVAVSSCDPANQGIWKVDKDTGAIELIAQAPSATVLNGIDVYGGYIYAADTFDGLVWRAPASGGTLELWADDPLLKLPPNPFGPGPNGLRVFRHKVYVAVSATGDLVAIPIHLGGAAGEAYVHATLPPGTGCDEFAIDLFGRFYCTTDPTNLLIRINLDGSSEVLLTADDLLDGPTSAQFGRRGKNRKNLYITNAAFPFFTTTFRPSLMRLRLDVPGAPFTF